MKLILFFFLITFSMSHIFKKINLQKGEVDLNFDGLFIGELIEIVVEGNPTTGYGWYIDQDINKFKVVDAINLHKVDNLYTGDYENSNDGMIGSPGMYSFKFVVKAKGNELIKIKYFRKWETSKILYSLIRVNFETE